MPHDLRDRATPISRHARPGARKAGPVRRLVVAALLVLIACMASAAQAPDERWSQLAQPMFQNIGASSGLANVVTTDVAQDKDGFLWVGTQGGLSRWDGYRFRNYVSSPDDSRSLPDNYVVTIHLDSHGRLWVGTMSGGLARYEPESDGFVTYNSKNAALAGGAVGAIEDDGAGGLWIGTDTGLDHMVGVADPAHARIVHFRHADGDTRGLPANVIRSLYRDAGGTLWVGTQKGLARRDPLAAGFVGVPMPERGAEAPNVNTLFMDSGGQLWIGTRGHGVFVLAPQTGVVRRFAETDEAASLMKNEIVTGIVEATDGEIWISSFAGGVAVVNRAGGRPRRIGYDVRAPGGLASAMVRSMFRDRAGAIWLATDSGLSQHEPYQAAVSVGRGLDGRPGLSEGYVNSIALAPDGHLWVGHVRQGVDVVDPPRAVVAAWPPGRARAGEPVSGGRVSALLADDAGIVWLATRSGLYRSDPRGNTVERVVAPWLDSGLDIRALARTGDMLWLGTTTEGVYQARVGAGAGLEKIRRVEGLISLNVNTLHAGPAGALWVGGNGGLNRVDSVSGAVVESFAADPKDPASLSNANVNSLHHDARGRLWVATNGGIDVMEDGGGAGKRRFLRLGVAQGLPNTNVSTLLGDRQGRVWSSTDDGIAVIDPATLAIEALGPADGVRYSPYFNHAGAATADGELVFGGAGGLTVVRPARYRPWRLDAPVVVTEARLGGKPVPPGRYNGAAAALVVQADANSFAVGFAALDFTAPGQNRYGYRLEGYDSDWTVVDAAHRVASYTNLPPGRYLLAIRGSNRHGLWSERMLRVPVIVRPWWYQTWWFRVAATLLVATALYYAYRLRTRQLAAQGTALEREVAARTAEVLQQKALADRRHREAADRNAELVEVNAVAQMLAGKLELDQLIALVGDQVRRVFGADSTHIALLEPDSGVIHFPYADGASVAPPRDGDDVCGRVIASGVGALLEGGRAPGAAPSTPAAPSCLCVPIIANGVTRGAVSVRRAGAFRASDQRLLETIAAHLGAALQNALLFGQAESARARAEEATRAKSMFLANMSHEIRTPMNAVIGLSYLALNSDSPSLQRDYVGKIHRAGTSLLGIISGILDFSKIEAGKLELESADFDLDDLLAHVAAVAGGGVAGGELECNFDVPAAVPRRLRGDALRLGQVLINLLNNALKFTQRGEVALTVRALDQQAGRVRLEFGVRDCGIGMTEDQMGRLFQAFTQADGSATRRFGGTGLGLSICKNLVDLMGGAIAVDSQPGVGSRFTVTLWLERASDALAPAPQLPAIVSGLRVLVVDDNATARAALLGALASLRIDVVAVGSAAEAASCVRQAEPRFDLLLVDAHLPGPGGAEAIARAAGARARPPKIAWLAGAAEGHGPAPAAGVAAVLVKPVTRAGMAEALLRLFAPGQRQGAPGEPPAPPRFGGARVLLVEDNPINQEIAVSLLQACDIRVELANHGGEAIERLQAVEAGYYQLVLMDLQMPGLDGHAATARLRRDARFDALPIIAVTASALPEDRQRCEQAGFDEHLSKPLIPADLYHMLARHLPAAAARARATRPPPLPYAVPGLDLADARLRLDGDDALLLKVLHMFRRDEHDSAARIRAALGRGDHAAAGRHAHSLRGLAEGIGAAAVARLAGELERAPRAAGTALDALDDALAALCAALERLPPEPVAAGAARVPAVWEGELRRLAELMRGRDGGAAALFAACAADFAASFGAWDADAIQRGLDAGDFDGAHAALRWVAHEHGLAI